MTQPPSEVVFFTSLRDCIVWSLRLLGLAVAAVFAISWIASFFRGQATAITARTLLEATAFVLGISVVAGLLFFFFGWLGRVIVSKEGIGAPKYSGFRQFFHWQDITDAETGSVNGWPCIIVRGQQSNAPSYLMVMGTRKSEMANWIRLHVDPTNPLVQHFGVMTPNYACMDSPCK